MSDAQLNRQDGVTMLLFVPIVNAFESANVLSATIPHLGGCLDAVGVTCPSPAAWH